MRAGARRTILAGVLAIASATGLQSCTETSAADAELLPAESAQVIAVVDGVTIDVQMAGGEARVRLIGLDTPEINRDGGQDDCYAQEARDELNTMVYGKAVELRADPTQDDTDRYGRLLRHVYIDGQSAAVVLLEAGAAHEYTYDAPYIGQTERRDAERAAQADELGMWGSCTG